MSRGNSTPAAGAAFAAALAALAAILLFIGTLGHEYVYDDLQIVRDNPLASAPPRLEEIFTSHYWKGFREEASLYRPVTMLSFSLVSAATGGGPTGQHAVNVLLHGAVAALVVLLAAALGMRPGWALAAGLLFAAHPVHVEAVAPVVGRSELLAALFGLGAWLAWLAGGEAGPLRRLARWAACPLLLAAALLSKEGMAVLPGLILAGELIRGGGLRRWRKWALPMGLAWLALPLWLAARHAVLSGMAQAPVGLEAFGGAAVSTRLLSAVGILGRYLGLMIWPATLSADYSFDQIPLITSALDLRFLWGALVHLALVAAALLLAFRRRLSGLGVLVYLGALLPVSNLLVPIGTVMGERLLYFPSVGLCIALPALIQEWIDASGSAPAWRRRLTAAALALACAVLAGRTLARVPEWRDQLTLFRATVRTSPRAGRAWLNLGVAEENVGNTEAALLAYRRAVGIRSHEPHARHRLGRLLLGSGRPAEAADHLRAATAGPRVPAGAWLDLGRALHALGRRDEAVSAFRRATEQSPGSWTAWFNLGQVRVEQGAAAEGLAAIERAEALNGREAAIPMQRGRVLALLGRHREALEAFRRCLELDPSRREALIPAALEALASGDRAGASRWAARARQAGLALPEALEPLAP